MCSLLHAFQTSHGWMCWWRCHLKRLLPARSVCCWPRRISCHWALGCSSSGSTGLCSAGSQCTGTPSPGPWRAFFQAMHANGFVLYLNLYTSDNGFNYWFNVLLFTIFVKQIAMQKWTLSDFLNAVFIILYLFQYIFLMYVCVQICVTNSFERQQWTLITNKRAVPIQFKIAFS